MDKVSGELIPEFVVALTVYHLIEGEEGDKKREFVTKKELTELLEEVLDEQAVRHTFKGMLNWSFVKGMRDDETKEVVFVLPSATDTAAIKTLYPIWKKEYLPRLKIGRTPE